MGNLDVLSNEILVDTVFLASLEQSYRSHFKWKRLDDKVVCQVSSEVCSLADIWLQNADRFGSTTQPIWSNPSFGDASAFVGGADADVVIGTALWDFKTTKYFKYTTINWAQLLGYVILSE